MIPLILRITVTGFAVAGALQWLASRHADAATRRSRLIKISIYAVVVHAMLFAASQGMVTFTALLGIIVLAGAYEMYGALETVGAGLRVAAGVAYMAVAAGLIAFGVTATSASAAYVYVVVATFDGFSQVAGQLLGRRRLAARISPGKTIEGLTGGALVALLLAVSLRGLVDATAARALIVGVGLVAAAFCGDLSASWLKRKSGTKDFGDVLPGHGGVLDRFDSLLFAASAWMLMR